MSTERWVLLEEIFNGALERSPQERRQYVEAAAADDQELQDDVFSLLASDSDAEGMLRDVVTQDVGEWLREQGSIEIGSHVGPYLIVRELDSGGMGAVHLAVRSDDQYFQIVAIKMIRKGFATPQLIQRFRAERQILATLAHPNVGVILDGGVTDDGRPFMVMEYVEGQSITQASKSRQLGIRERIDLFLAACSAVHYAHQKLIIHRDIKPTNILVTADGVVKLIDFGIAKPLLPEMLLGGQVPADLSYQPMTPDYASPEQLSNQELTPSTDIYSLGVLLFELLTDVPPHNLRGLPLEKAVKVLREGARVKPSSLPHLDSRRRREISGDLDWIVLKALEVDTTRRYASVQDLEEDLVRYLEGRPLRTQRSCCVKIAKFLKRHKPVAITIVSCVVLVGLAFLAYTIRARRADRRVEQIRTLADSMILQLTDQLQQVPNSTETQAAVFHRALEFLKDLGSHTQRDPRLSLELSNAYLRVGESEGSPFVPNLGNSGTAITSYQLALSTAMQAYGLLPNDDGRLAVIKAHQHLAAIHVFLGDVRQADDEFRQTLAWAVPFYEKNRTDSTRIRLLAMIYEGMGDNDLHKLLPNEALNAYTAAIEIFGTKSNGQEEHDLLLADLHLDEAAALNELGDQARALEQLEQGRRLTEDLARKFPHSRKSTHELMTVYGDMVLVLSGRDLLNISDSARSETYSEKFLSMAEHAAADDSKNAQAGFDLSLAMQLMGDAHRQVSPEIAAKWYRRSGLTTKEWLPRYGAAAKHRLAIEDEGLAEVLNGPGEAKEKLAHLHEANLIRSELSDSSPHARLHLMSSYCRLTDADIEANNLSAAAKEAARARAMFSEFNSASPSLMVLRDLGLCFESQGNFERRLAADTHLSPRERGIDSIAAQNYYQQSSAVWDEWDRRGASTPESNRVRQRVQQSAANRIAKNALLLSAGTPQWQQGN